MVNMVLIKIKFGKKYRGMVSRKPIIWRVGKEIQQCGFGWVGEEGGVG